MRYRLCQIDGEFGVSRLVAFKCLCLTLSLGPFPGIRTGRARPYKVDATSTSMTDIELNLRHGKAARHFTMEIVSNAPVELVSLALTNLRDRSIADDEHVTKRVNSLDWSRLATVRKSPCRLRKS